MKHVLRNQKGFSLLEIIATLGILLGLLLIISPYAYRHLNSGNLEYTRHTLREGIRSIEQTAVSQATNYRMTFDTVEERYDVSVYDSVWTLQSRKDLPQGIQFETTTFPNNEVTFDRLGAPSSAGTVTLKDQNGNTKVIEIVSSGLVHLP